jgi:hypothetical protein
MTDTPKPDADKPSPPTPTTRELLLARGWKEVPPTGKGYILPIPWPLPKKNV